MEEFSLYVLDITMNSVRAGAKNIEITLEEKGETLYFSVDDDGCGMTQEQLSHLKDPFFTTRKTRKVGLGVPFLSMLAEQTGGKVSITSRTVAEFPDCHGTKIEATFGLNHIDFIPIGDMTGTIVTLIQGSPLVNFTFRHTKKSGSVTLSCRDLRDVLGDGISLSEPEILAFIKNSLDEEYASLG